MTNQPLLLGYTPMPKQIKSLGPESQAFYDYMDCLIDIGFLDDFRKGPNVVRKIKPTDVTAVA